MFDDEVEIPLLPLVRLNYERTATAFQGEHPAIYLTLTSESGAHLCKFSMKGRDISEAHLEEQRMQKSAKVIEVSDSVYSDVVAQTGTMRGNSSVIGFTSPLSGAAIDKSGFSSIPHMLSNHPTVLRWNKECGDGVRQTTWHDGSGSPPTLYALEQLKVSLFLEAYKRYLNRGGHVPMIHCLAQRPKSLVQVTMMQDGVATFLSLPRDVDSLTNKEVIAMILHITGQLSMVGWHDQLHEIKESYIPKWDAKRSSGKFAKIYTFLFALYELCVARPVSKDERMQTMNYIKYNLKEYDTTFWFGCLKEVFDESENAGTLPEQILVPFYYMKTFTLNPSYATSSNREWRVLYADFEFWVRERADGAFLASTTRRPSYSSQRGSVQGSQPRGSQAGSIHGQGSQGSQSKTNQGSHQEGNRANDEAAQVANMEATTIVNVEAAEGSHRSGSASHSNLGSVGSQDNRSQYDKADTDSEFSASTGYTLDKFLNDKVPISHSSSNFPPRSNGFSNNNRSNSNFPDRSNGFSKGSQSNMSGGASFSAKKLLQTKQQSNSRDSKHHNAVDLLPRGDANNKSRRVPRT